MIIYGVALLAACLLAGLYIGELLGQLLGVQANVGGVGIAMLLLVLAGGSSRLQWPAVHIVFRGVCRRGDPCHDQQQRHRLFAHAGRPGHRL